VRFADFLRVAVLLFGGAGTVLAVVAIAGATGKEDQTLIFVAVSWWALASAVIRLLRYPPERRYGAAREFDRESGHVENGR